LQAVRVSPKSLSKGAHGSHWPASRHPHHRLPSAARSQVGCIAPSSPPLSSTQLSLSGGARARGRVHVHAKSIHMCTLHPCACYIHMINECECTNTCKEDKKSHPFFVSLSSRNNEQQRATSQQHRRCNDPSLQLYQRKARSYFIETHSQNPQVTVAHCSALSDVGHAQLPMQWVPSLQAQPRTMCRTQASASLACGGSTAQRIQQQQQQQHATRSSSTHAWRRQPSAA